MIKRFETFVTVITDVHRSIQKIKIQEMSDFGLKGTHVMCLFYLQKNPEGLTATQIVKYCEEDKAAVSRTLKELSERNLIMYHDFPGQRRYRSKITLTEKGNEITTAMNKKISHMVEIASEGFSKEERMIFYHVLRKISVNLKETLENGGLKL